MRRRRCTADLARRVGVLMRTAPEGVVFFAQRSAEIEVSGLTLLFWLTPGLFRLRRVTLFRQSNQTISLHCPAPPSSGFPPSGTAPWARRKRAIHGPMRLSRHPCRSAHCATPALGLPKSQPVASAKSTLMNTTPFRRSTACRRQLFHGPYRRQARLLRDRCRAFDLLLILIRDGPDTAKRDLGAGRTQVSWSGSSRMDAARGVWAMDGPFTPGPRSKTGVEGSPTKEDPNQEQDPLVTWGRSGVPAFPSNSTKSKQVWR